jgi:hypothetical protein
LRHIAAEQARLIESAAAQGWDDRLPCPMRRGFSF